MAKLATTARKRIPKVQLRDSLEKTGFRFLPDSRQMPVMRWRASASTDRRLKRQRSEPPFIANTQGIGKSKK